MNNYEPSRQYYAHSHHLLLEGVPEYLAKQLEEQHSWDTTQHLCQFCMTSHNFLNQESTQLCTLMARHIKDEAEESLEHLPLYIDKHLHIRRDEHLTYESCSFLVTKGG